MSYNNTRNPHHNRWGGKNNTWGNRNRKKKTSNSQYNGSMSKIGGAIIGGIFLFTLAHYGKAYRPQCGQTQAFWSADKRNGGGAVENRTA